MAFGYTELYNIYCKFPTEERYQTSIAAGFWCLEVMMTPFLFQERMTLKHSSATKWARQQLTRGHKDPAVSVLGSEPESKNTI